jgi:hypothetical protein
MKIERIGLLLVGILAALAAPPRVARAVGDVYWDGGGGADLSWAGDTAPTSGNDAHVGNSSYTKKATADVIAANAVCRRLLLGEGAATTGMVRIVNRNLTVSENLYLGRNGLGVIEQNGGTCTVAAVALIGSQAGLPGRYALSNGAVCVVGQYVELSQNANAIGIVAQGVGSSVVVTQYMTVGSAAAATYSIDRGTLRIKRVGVAAGTPSLKIQKGSTYRQSGGTNLTAGYIRLVELAGESGRMTLTNGAYLRTGYMEVARRGTGTFEQVAGSIVELTNSSASFLYVGYVGDNSTRGNYVQFGGRLFGTVGMSIRSYDANTRGFYRGWGANDLSGEFKMSGLTTADGRGEARDLLITNYSSLANSFANGTGETNGWYAANKGRLVLKPVASAASMLWGESGSGVDLVNSAKLDLTGYSGSGSLTGSLWAADHPAVPPTASAAAVLGVWRFGTKGFAFASANATFRYDHARAAALGVENDLKVYTHTGNAGDGWLAPAAQGLDKVNKRLVASNLTALAWFAVGKDIPAPLGQRGTVINIR